MQDQLKVADGASLISLWGAGRACCTVGERKPLGRCRQNACGHQCGETCDQGWEVSTRTLQCATASSTLRSRKCDANGHIYINRAFSVEMTTGLLRLLTLLLHIVYTTCLLRSTQAQTSAQMMMLAQANGAGAVAQILCAPLSVADRLAVTRGAKIPLRRWLNPGFGPSAGRWDGRGREVERRAGRQTGWRRIWPLNTHAGNLPHRAL
jgi:hypothetical protein